MPSICEPHYYCTQQTDKRMMTCKHITQPFKPAKNKPSMKQHITHLTVPCECINRSTYTRGAQRHTIIGTDFNTTL